MHHVCTLQGYGTQGAEAYSLYVPCVFIVGPGRYQATEGTTLLCCSRKISSVRFFGTRLGEGHVCSIGASSVDRVSGCSVLDCAFGSVH